MEGDEVRKAEHQRGTKRRESRRVQLEKASPKVLLCLCPRAYSDDENTWKPSVSTLK